MKRPSLCNIFCAGIAILLLMSCGPKPFVAPKLIKESILFVYPAEAREKHIEGTVLLKVHINEKGEVNQAEIERSSGYDILDETALKVARAAKFKPARIQGKVRPVWITWPLVFEITSMEFIPEEWVSKASLFHMKILSSPEPQRSIALQGLYYHYKDYSRYMAEHRKLFLNEAAMKVVLPEVRDQWEEFANEWPLTFVLFQDYVLRYPDSKFSKEAEDYLIEYMKNEMFQLRIRSKSMTLSKKGRKKLYNRLLNYLQKNYPKSVTKEMLEGIK